MVSPHVPLVAIILLNYSRYNETFACLDSLSILQGEPVRIAVVDNASPNDSVEQLRKRLLDYPGEFELVESKTNLGYSGGCNLGIRFLQATGQTSGRMPDFFWLLNNDATIEADTLPALLEEAQKTGGLAGSLLLYPDGRYQQVGTRFNWWTGRSRGYPEKMVHDGMAVEMLTGASWLIPASAFGRVGLLDESFFLYFEDGEFSLRCHHAGFPLTIATRSRVFHKESATTGKTSPATQYYYHRNRLRLLIRLASPPQKMTIHAYSIFRLLRFVIKCAANLDRQKLAANRIALKAYWLALTDFWRDVDGSCPHSF